MKVHPQTRMTAISLAAGMLLAAACTTGNAPAVKEVVSHRTGDLVISLLSASGDLAQGQNDFVIAFRTSNNQPFDAGTVSVSASMAMPGMTPMTAPVELQPADKKGEYALKGDFAMSGAWRFEVRWDGPGGRGNTVFQSSVR